MNSVQIKQRRLLDWRLVISLCLVVTVGLLVFGYVNNAHELAVKDQQAKVRDGEINALIAVTKQQDAEAASDRASAVKDRAAALASQRRQAAQLRLFVRRQNALLAYLRSIGVNVPMRFSTASSTSSATRAPSAKKAVPPKSRARKGNAKHK